MTTTRKTTPKARAAKAAPKAVTKAATRKASTSKATRKAPAKSAKRAPAKGTAPTTNVGKTCSVRGCDLPAKRRGMCSGKGSANHYRKALRAEKAASK